MKQEDHVQLCWNPRWGLTLPPSDRWRPHGAEQFGLLGQIHSHYWGGGRGLRHSELPCWLRRCEAASASSCLWRSRLQSVSAKSGPPPAGKTYVTVDIMLNSDTSLAEWKRMHDKGPEEHLPTSQQEATALCRGVSHLLSLAFTLAPARRRTEWVSLFEAKSRNKTFTLEFYVPHIKNSTLKLLSDLSVW